MTVTDQKKNSLVRASTDFLTVFLDKDKKLTYKYVDYLGVRSEGGLRWNDHVDKMAPGSFQ